MSGVRLAASYSYLPNCLGFCGSQKKGDLLLMEEFIERKISEKKIIPVLEKLEAAFFYYKLIARKNGIKNPFAKKVIEAYWIGNELLEKVSRMDLQKMILKDFVKPHLLTVAEAQKRIKKIPKGSKAHHSFHVFILGPIAGRIDMKELSLKDVCRTGFGEVLEVKKEKNGNFLLVNFQPIVTNDRKYLLGQGKKIKIKWNKNILPKVKIGETVSFHWGTAVQVLNKSKTENVIKYTENTLGLLS